MVSWLYLAGYSTLKIWKTLKDLVENTKENLKTEAIAISKHDITLDFKNSSFNKNVR